MIFPYPASSVGVWLLEQQPQVVGFVILVLAYGTNSLDRVHGDV